MAFMVESLETRRLLSAAGTLDLTFGSFGTVVDAAGTGPTQRMQVLGDGSYVTAGMSGGSLVVNRYTPSGRSDVSFNGTGHEVVALKLKQTPLGDLRMLADGRIAFSVGNVIGRLLVSGGLDPTLNVGGRHPGVEAVTAPDARLSVVTAPAMDGGFFFAYGDIMPQPMPTNEPFLHLGKLKADGSLDTSFGSGGIVDESTNFEYANPEAMVVTDDGGVTAAGGQNAFDSSLPDPFLTRFSAAGVQLGTTDAGAQFAFLTAWAVGAGKVFASSQADSGALMNPDGTSSTIGINVAPLTAGPYATLTPLAVDASGDIYAGGSIPRIGHRGTDFAVARYTPSGHLDLSFGQDGLARVTIGGSADWSVEQIKFDPSGRLLVAGSDGSHAVVARLLNSVGAGEVADTTPPKIFRTGTPYVTSSGRALQIRFTVIDDGAIQDDFTFPPGNDAIQIVGPNGVVRTGTIDEDFFNVSVPNTDSVLPIIATFAGTHGRHGQWSSADDGTYTIRLLGNKIADEAGNFAPAQTLGTFTVRI